jgi:hypothetical protein
MCVFVAIKGGIELSLAPSRQYSDYLIIIELPFNYGIIQDFCLYLGKLGINFLSIIPICANKCKQKLEKKGGKKGFN